MGYNIDSGWFVLTYALFRCKCGSYSRQKVRQLHVLGTVVRRVCHPITQVRFLLCACPCMAVWLAFITQLVVVCQGLVVQVTYLEPGIEFSRLLR